MKILVQSIIGLIFLLETVTAQQTAILTLDSCYKSAIVNNPLSRQQTLYNESWQLQESLLDNNYLPLISVGGQASVQTDVTSLPI